MTNRIASLLLLSAALAFTGCKTDSAVTQGETLGKTASPATASAPAAAAPTPAELAHEGRITGVVNFKGVPPKRIQIDMSMDPACTMTNATNMTEQYIVDHGKLANVYIYVKSGVPSTSAPAGAPPVVLDQKNCRYTPHVVAVQQGGSIKFDNSDPTMHNIHIVPAKPGNPPIDISQTPLGQPQTRQFNSPETMLSVRCNNHPWMNAFINVASSPFFAVTGADGSFTIKGLPPGTYTLAAVHEKLGEQDIQVTVRPHDTTKVKFTFSK